MLVYCPTTLRSERPVPFEDRLPILRVPTRLSAKTDRRITWTPDEASVQTRLRSKITYGMPGGLCGIFPLPNDGLKGVLGANGRSRYDSHSLAENISDDRISTRRKPELDSWIEDLKAGAVPPEFQDKFTGAVYRRTVHRKFPRDPANSSGIA